jgi:ornithine carbamoyltransferase
MPPEEGAMNPAVRHFLDLWSLEATTLRRILDDAAARKAARAGWTQGRVDADAPGRERTLAMIFEKNSTRTRFSFDAAMRQLGGDVIISTAADMQLGRGETIADTARVLSRMVDAVMLRTNRHTDHEDLAANCAVPVINGLSDTGHPQWAGDLTLDQQADLIAGARGLSGRNIDYLSDLVRHLHEDQVRDACMERLLVMVEAREARAGG